MPTTFQKRQKEMKRMEKQRMKAERRAQRKLEKNAGARAPEDVEGALEVVEGGSPDAESPDRADS